MQTPDKLSSACRTAGFTLLIAFLLLTSCVSINQSSGPYPVASSQTKAGAPVLRTENLPVVLVMIDEKNLGSIPTAEVETMAGAILIEQKFRTVDQDLLRANLEQRKTLLKKAGDNRGAASLGLQFGAGVIIVGTAVCQPSARRIADTNLRTYQAVATLRAVRTDNASVIATASETGTAMDVEDVSGGSKALKSAGEKSLKALIPALALAWSQTGGLTDADQTPIHKLELTFGGVDQLWKVKAIREGLRKMEAMQSVTQRNYTSGSVIFDVACRRPAEEIAEDLVLSPPEGLKMQVLSVEAGKIVLKANTLQ